MQLRKFISTVSAVAVAASVFAGLALSASAENTVLVPTITYDESGATPKFTAGPRFATSVTDSPGGVNTTKCEYMTGSVSSNGYGYYVPLTDAQATDKTLIFEFDAYFNARVANLSLSAGGSRAATTAGRALTFSYNANDGKVKIGNSSTFGNVTTVGNAQKWLHIIATVSNASKSTELEVYDTRADGDYSSATANYSATVPFSDDTLAAVKGFDFFAPNTVGIYIDNITISEYVPSSTIEPISSVAITGADKMTFGADPDTAASNPYTVVITGENGTTLTENNISRNVTDFNVAWDIDGFKTANDTEGQYCDSYGVFSVNNDGKVATSFDLRNVPMNFYGKMTATVTYNGETFVAEKYVVALGNTTTNKILPEGGYPSDFDDYPSSIIGYSALRDTFGSKYDPVIGGWVFAGSYGNSTATVQSDGTNKYLRVTTDTGNSHAFSNNIATPSAQAIFKQSVRFVSGQPNLSLNTKVYSANNTCPVILQYSGGTLTLNGESIKSADGNDVTVSANKWYDVVLSVDKTTETCYVSVYDNGSFVGGVANVDWTATCNPVFYTIGSPGKKAGTIDIASYSAYYPTADESTYTLTASQDTLSIPNGDTAELTASLKTAEGYDITGVATWTVLEADMAAGVIITPDAADSHKATVTLGAGAIAGEATVRVNIGGYTKTIKLTITSSAERVKFTKSSTSVSIPLSDTPITAEYAASVVDAADADLERDVTFGIYDKSNTSAYTLPAGITFANGILTVTKAAPAVTFTIRATGKNTDGSDISKSVKVTVHGLSFDFGTDDESALAEGYTAVTADTSYTAERGYGIASGSVAAGGTGSTSNAAADWLEGAITFKADVEKGKNYTVAITYQGTLATGYVNSDLAGYELGTQSSLATASYSVPVPVDALDLIVSGDGAKIAAITITKDADKAPKSTPDIHHIGDSTAANNGSWAYTLAKSSATYPELFALATFCNNGAGGRNLGTYYTQGKLAGVLREIEPGDIVMFGNNGTNGMGSYFEDDVNYYLDAAEAMGARIIINSYTPHGAVSGYASGYNSSTHTFNSYRKDSYDNIVREVAAERAASDPNYLGFVEIGKNADAAFNAYVADYAANGYDSADAAAQAIIACFSDHNHYSNGTIARELMLNGYGDVKGIVAQLTGILTEAAADDANWTYDYGDAIVETKGNDAATGWLVTVTNGAKRTAYGFDKITALITSGGVTKTFTKNYGTEITLDAGGAATFGIVIAGLNDYTATISVEVE